MRKVKSRRIMKEKSRNKIKQNHDVKVKIEGDIFETSVIKARRVVRNIFLFSTDT